MIKQKYKRKRVRYGVLYRDSNQIYWVLDRVTTSKFLAYFWRTINRIIHYESELRYERI